MTDDLNHAEIQELLGAYALGAVDEGERAAVEAHLETCEPCRSELADHRRLAQALRRHAAAVSPLAGIGSDNRSAGAGEHLAVPPKPRRRWEIPVAAAIALVILGGLFAQGQVRARDLEARMRRVERLGQAPPTTADQNAVLTTLRTPRNEPVLSIVGPGAGGVSYALNSVLPQLGSGQTYELWRIDNNGVTAAAPLGGHPDATALSLPAGVTGFLLTVEYSPVPAGPTLPAVATGRVGS